MNDHEDDPELIEPRPDERLALDALEPYLRTRLPQTDAPLTVRQFGGGHANLTYLLRFGATEYVLRRPPLGPIAPSSHDMKREHRVLSRLHRGFDLAPRSYLYCEDESVIGAPFQIMERRRGTVIRKELPPALASDARLKRRMGEMVVEVLARFHQLDRARYDLADLGHPQGFVRRQLEGWTRRWQAARDEASPRMERLIAWLEAELHESGAVSLLHNDYKLDNLLVDAADPATPVAILDWDMCTSGDPLMDLGYLLNQWVEPGDPPDWIENSSMPSDDPDFPDRAEVVERYARATGFDVANVGWHYAFAAMKFAVIIQQIYVRYLRGQTRDERFARYHLRVKSYIDKGCTIAGI